MQIPPCLKLISFREARARLYAAHCQLPAPGRQVPGRHQGVHTGGAQEVGLRVAALRTHRPAEPTPQGSGLLLTGQACCE